MSDEFCRALLPAELPESPAGWTKAMAVHLNLGRAQSATYQVFDPDGRPMPFSYAYHVRDKIEARNYAGFILPGFSDQALTWQQLREAWPTYYSKLLY